MIKGRGATQCLICDKASEHIVYNDPDIISGIKLIFNTDKFNIMLMSSMICIKCKGRLHQLFDFNLVKTNLDMQHITEEHSSDPELCYFCDEVDCMRGPRLITLGKKAIEPTKWWMASISKAVTYCCFSCYNFLLFYSKIKRILEQQRHDFYANIKSWKVCVSQPEYVNTTVISCSTEDTNETNIPNLVDETVLDLVASVVSVPDKKTTSYSKTRKQLKQKFAAALSETESKEENVDMEKPPPKKRSTIKNSLTKELVHLQDCNYNDVNVNEDKFTMIKKRRSKNRPTIESESKKIKQEQTEKHSMIWIPHDANLNIKSETIQILNSSQDSKLSDSSLNKASLEQIETPETIQEMSTLEVPSPMNQRGEIQDDTQEEANSALELPETLQVKPNSPTNAMNTDGSNKPVSTEDTSITSEEKTSTNLIEREILSNNENIPEAVSIKVVVQLVETVSTPFIDASVLNVAVPIEAIEEEISAPLEEVNLKDADYCPPFPQFVKMFVHTSSSPLQTPLKGILKMDQSDINSTLTEPSSFDESDQNGERQTSGYLADIEPTGFDSTLAELSTFEELGSSVNEAICSILPIESKNNEEFYDSSFNVNDIDMEIYPQLDDLRSNVELATKPLEEISEEEIKKRYNIKELSVSLVRLDHDTMKKILGSKAPRVSKSGRIWKPRIIIDPSDQHRPRKSGSLMKGKKTKKSKASLKKMTEKSKTGGQRCIIPHDFSESNEFSEGYVVLEETNHDEVIELSDGETEEHLFLPRQNVTTVVEFLSPDRKGKLIITGKCYTMVKRDVAKKIQTIVPKRHIVAY